MAMLVGYLLLLLGAWMNNHNLRLENILIGAAAYIVMIALGAATVIVNYVEVTDKETIYYRFPFTYRAPIQKIIKMGFPKQNYISQTYSSFMYVWYDDPKRPGVDQYIKIKQGQFDDRTLVKIARDIKAANPKVEVDEKLQKLIEKYRG